MLKKMPSLLASGLPKEAARGRMPFWSCQSVILLPTPSKGAVHTSRPSERQGGGETPVWAAHKGSASTWSKDACGVGEIDGFSCDASQISS